MISSLPLTLTPYKVAKLGSLLRSFLTAARAFYEKKTRHKIKVMIKTFINFIFNTQKSLF